MLQKQSPFTIELRGTVSTDKGPVPNKPANFVTVWVFSGDHPGPGLITSINDQITGFASASTSPSPALPATPASPASPPSSPASPSNKTVENSAPAAPSSGSSTSASDAAFSSVKIDSSAFVVYEIAFGLLYERLCTDMEALETRDIC